MSCVTVDCHWEITLKSSLPITFLQWSCSSAAAFSFLLSCKREKPGHRFRLIQSNKRRSLKQRVYSHILQRNHGQTLAEQLISFVAASSEEEVLRWANCLSIGDDWDFFTFAAFMRAAICSECLKGWCAAVRWLFFHCLRLSPVLENLRAQQETDLRHDSLSVVCKRKLFNK